MFGLSGAGKSTFQSKCLNNNSKCLISKPVKLWQSWVYIFTIFLTVKMFMISPVTLVEIIKTQQGRGLLLKLGFRYSGIIFRKIKLRCEFFLLQDSGVLMPIVSSVINNNWSIDFKKLDLILKSIPIADKVIYLSVPAEVAFKRYLQRESGLHTKIESFYKAYDVCNYIYEFINFQGKEILVVDNTALVISCSSIKKILKVKK